MKLSSGQDSSKNRPLRLPLRSVKELAEEFGVTALSLSRYLVGSGLKPQMVLRHTAVKNTWYVPGPVRAWWKTRNPSQP